MAIFKKDKEPELLPMPQHVAIIMDGNGRWATSRHLPRTAGHAAGAETFRKITLLPGDRCEISDGLCLLHRELEAPAGESRRKIMSLMKDYLLSPSGICRRTMCGSASLEIWSPEP